MPNLTAKFDNEILLMADTFMTTEYFLPSILHVKTYNKFELE